MRTLLFADPNNKKFGLAHDNDMCYVISYCCSAIVQNKYHWIVCTVCNTNLRRSEGWAFEISLPSLKALDPNIFRRWALSWTGVDDMAVMVEGIE